MSHAPKLAADRVSAVSGGFEQGYAAVLVSCSLRCGVHGLCPLVKERRLCIGSGLGDHAIGVVGLGDRESPIRVLLIAAPKCVATLTAASTRARSTIRSISRVRRSQTHPLINRDAT